jgi:hypothetical protein
MESYLPLFYRNVTVMVASNQDSLWLGVICLGRTMGF